MYKNGYKIVHTDNINSAIEINKEWPFNVIVIDLNNLNELGANDFYLFKEINPDVIIIITVEFGNIDSAIKSCKMGVDDYITKPFGSEHLQFTIEKISKIKELKTENKLLHEKLRNRKSN